MEREIFLHFGSGVGLTMLDIILLLGCPFCASLGTIVSSLIERVSNKPTLQKAKELPTYKKDLANLTDEEKLAAHNEELEAFHRKATHYYQRNKLWRLFFIGLILGFVVALYFVGAITNNITSVARIFALCVLLGYQAPKIWSLQERLLQDAVEKHLKTILSGKPLEDNKDKENTATDT